MLKRVRLDWIDGVLRQSLYKVARIELGLEASLDAVEQPVAGEFLLKPQLAFRIAHKQCFCHRYDVKLTCAWRITNFAEKSTVFTPPFPPPSSLPHHRA